jgi:hypothetical protein
VTRALWTVGALVCIISTVGNRAEAQQPVVAGSTSVKVDSMKADTTMRTTQAGVFTDAQAKRGQQVYAGSCSSCHQPTSHTGEPFNQNWKGHPLSDLFLYVSTQMPQDNPGSLSPGDAADVVSFLLKIYMMPSGSIELAPDTLAMKKIIIATGTQGSK